MDILVFGDQTDDARSCLRHLLRIKADPISASFLTGAYQAIRAELLPPHRSNHQSEWRFSNLLELLDIHPGNSIQGVALEHALSTICHFGLFFERCRQSQGRYPDPDSTQFVGICVGSLAAAAISCCRTPSELLPIALEVCVLAFRSGELAAEAGARLCSDSSRPHESWGLAVPKSKHEYVKRGLDVFTRSKQLPSMSRPFISMISLQSVTICGPPEVLSSLRECEGFPNSIWLSLHAPYHSPNIYKSSDLDALLSRSCTIEWGKHSLNAGELSSAKVHHDGSLRSALKKALEGIFLKPVDCSQLVDAMKLHLDQFSVESATLIPFASAACRGMYQALATKSAAHISLADPVLIPPTDGAIENTYQSTSQAKIAIVGMSGRFPGANSVSEFWDLLLEGVDAHQVVPPLRWSAESHVDVSEKPGKNTSGTPYGCWLEEPGLFDAKFFGMSPREAKQVDPAQRLALMTAYEALEDGGIVPGTRSTQSHRVGVCYGVTSNDWMETNSAQEIDTFLIPGGNRAFIPGRINYCFKFSGPSLAIDTACSSSLAAIHTACNILWRDEADTMICGGTNIITNPDFTAGLDRGRFLSRKGNCMTFDDEADGYCRGEGVATVILKRLDDAILDNDPIRGVIVNACTNHSAEAESITRPCLDAQRYIFKNVLDGLDPANLSYVEMHGTGTQVGDATEMGSVLDAVAPASGPRCRSNFPVHFGSVKANIGHGEAAAGATSLIKILLMMQNDTIPPHIGIKTRINRKFPTDLAARGVRIATTPVEWRQHGTKPRRALLNNFSAAGGNTTLLLEDAPRKNIPEGGDPRSTHPVVLSGKSYAALQANAKAMLGFLQNSPHVDLASFSYTTTARRIHHAHRIAVSGSSLPHISERISAALDKGAGKTRVVAARSVVFAFTGQGSHYIGMARDLYQHLASFRKDIELFNRIVSNEGFAPFIDLIKQSGGDETSFSSEAVQLAIVCLQMALTKLWLSWGVVPEAVVGHSLGHYAALNAAGVISEADTIFLVGTRARILQSKCHPGTHSMLSVRCSPSVIEPYLGATAVEVACINSPHETVLSGLKQEIELLHTRLLAKKIPSRILAVPFAFHSSQVDCILEDFESAISGVTFHAPCIPVLCPRTESLVQSDGLFGPAHLVDHLRNRVNFSKALEVARDERIITDDTIFVEIGHNRTVTSMLKAALGSQCQAFPSLTNKQDAWTTLNDALSSIYMAGFAIKWDEYHREFARGLRVVPVPKYSWDLQHYWIQYVNDWSLRKGDPDRMLPPSQSMISTTIHSVVKEDLVNSSKTIILRSDLSSTQLNPLVKGHKVNGLPLSTPSIYADIASTVAKYLQNKMYSKVGGKQISIDNMSIEKALIAQPKGPQWLQTEVEVTDGDDLSAVCRFSSVKSDGTLIVSHASCVLSFRERPTQQVLQVDGLNACKKIEHLRKGLATGSSYRFNASMIYRMVATLADFDRGYRGLKEIVLDSNAMAAAARIDFSSIPRSEKEVFAAHPAWVDALSQSAGFVMNANENSDLGVECFVNHGWEGFRLYEELRRDSVYESVVEMTRGEGSIWQGTLSVVCEKRVVAVFEGIKLQGVPTRLLYQVLSAANKLQSGERLENGKEHQALDIGGQMDRPKVLETEYGGDFGLDAALEKIVDIVAEESGMDRADIRDDTDFVSVGIDSLLALLITSRMRDDLGFDIGSTISIFDKFNTVGQLKAGYARSRSLMDDTTSKSTSENESGSRTPNSDTSGNTLGSQRETNRSGSDVTRPSPGISAQEDVRAVTSIVLQRGSAAQGGRNRTLFLFPDGSGSAASYAALPPVSDSVTIIGLVCPYRQDPEAMKCSLDALVASYIAEIRRKQPDPPYSVGGWSAGGIIAYRATQMLLDAGAAVRDIVLIDSPAPNDGLERLPARFYEHCTEAGVFGQIGGDVAANKHEPSKWLIPHFNATIDLLSTYRAPPLRAPSHALFPRIALCWAGKTALDGQRYAKFEANASDGEGVRFLSESRTDFGPGGWGELMQAASSAGREIRIEVLEEWDHFGIMYGSGARALAGFLHGALQ